jgi:hypothetical protein
MSYVTCFLFSFSPHFVADSPDPMRIRIQNIEPLFFFSQIWKPPQFEINNKSITGTGTSTVQSKKLRKLPILCIFEIKFKRICNRSHKITGVDTPYRGTGTVSVVSTGTGTVPVVYDTVDKINYR